MDQAVRQAGSTGVQKRVAWLDAAKFIGIFLVILGHIDVKTYGFFSLNDFIGVFHMPLFFFLSGLTQKNLSFKESLKDAARKLLVPYAVFYFLNWLWWLPVSCLRHPEIYSSVFYDGVVRSFLGFLLTNNCTTKFSVMADWPLWFCAGLFWCKVLYSLVKNKTRSPEKVNIVLSALLLFLAFVLHYFDIPKVVTVSIGKYTFDYTEILIPFSLQPLTSRYVYFFAGTLLKERLFTNKNKSPKTWSALLAALFLVFTGVMDFFISQPETHDIYLSLLAATCGIAFVYELSRLLSPLPRFLTFLGRNTITILAFHTITNGLPSVFMKYILHYDLAITKEHPAGIGLALLVAVVSLLLCAVPAFVFERWFPFVLGRRKRA